MRRRYSSTTKIKCYNCNRQFQRDDLNVIKVIRSNNQLNDYDYEQRYVCDDCQDEHYGECCHSEQHINRPILLDLDNHESHLQLDGDYYCPYCKGKYITTCENCDQYIDKDDNDTHQYDGDYYCEECFNDQFTSCDQCGEIIRRDDSHWTYSRDRYQFCVCQNCADQFILYCYRCNDQIHRFHDDYYTTHDGDDICSDCYENNYFYCEGCNEVYDINDQLGGTDEYGWYCEQCWRDHVGRQIRHKNQVDPQEETDRVQYDYGTKIKPKLKKRLTQQETKQYIGVQLQLQNINRDPQETTNFIDQISKNKKLICKVDGSLDALSGVQINTVPCTYNYHLRSFGWQHVFNVINEYNMTNTEGAGLHFHISKNNFTTDQQKAIDYFVNNCVHTLSIIGGRDYANNGYCKAQPNKTQWGYNKQRHQAVNFHNTNTIQLRFPKATSNYNIFKKRLRMVHNICKLVKLFSFDDIKTLDQENLTYIFEEIIKQM